MAPEIDRRGFLRCMAWAGTGVAWTVTGGLLSGCQLPGAQTGGQAAARPRSSDIFFVQVSDSHIGFRGPANQDVTGTFQLAIEQVNALPDRPAFVMHTGDLTHTATAGQFDAVKQLLGTIRAGGTFQVPGEHDAVTGDDHDYLGIFGKGATGSGYYSFDLHGVHFLALVNAVATQGMGHLGRDQLDWIRKDLAGLSSETPIVVFAHIPLFAMYPAWGWSTDDAVQALGMMRRFGAVTCLNGHVHQVMSKVEGNVTFHTAAATAFPQPKPGQAPNPGPLTVPAGELHQALGVTEARYTVRSGHVAVIDDPLRP